jgi:protein-disulfide isomerase
MDEHVDTLDAPSPEPVIGPSPSPRRSSATIALVTMLAVGLAGGFVLGRITAPSPGSAPSPSGPAPSGTPAAGSSPSASSADPYGGVPRAGTRLGRPDADVTLEIWADYQCPFCRRFANEVMPTLVPLLQDGTIAVVHRDYAFLGQESFDAAVAARCAAREDRYWPMHDAIYGAQSGENEGAFARPVLTRLAASVGLEAAAFAACLDDRAVLLDVLDETAAAVRVGVTSTPTALVVGGARFTGLPSIDELTAAIEDVAAGASAPPSPSPFVLPDEWAAATADGGTAGRADAPVVVELWTDYQAETAPTFGEEVQPVLREAAAEGRIFVRRHDLAALGPESEAAAVAVRCADAQDRSGWFVHDVLLASGQGVEAGVFTRDNLTRFATRLGFEVRLFDACLDDATVLAAVRADTASAEAAGVTTAPALVILAGDRVVEVLQGTIAPADVEAAIAAAEG